MVRISSFLLAAAALATSATASSITTYRSGYCFSVSTTRRAVFSAIARTAIQSAINYLDQIASGPNQEISYSLKFSASGAGSRSVTISVDLVPGGVITATEARSLFEEILGYVNSMGGVPEFIAGAIGGADDATRSLLAASVDIDLFQGSQEFKLAKRDYPPRPGDSIHEWCEDEVEEDKKHYG